jgi:hypothetical protein
LKIIPDNGGRRPHAIHAVTGELRRHETGEVGSGEDGIGSIGFNLRAPEIEGRILKCQLSGPREAGHVGAELDADDIVGQIGVAGGQSAGVVVKVKFTVVSAINARRSS